MEVVGEERTPDLLKPQPQMVPSPPTTSPTTNTPTPSDAYMAGLLGTVNALSLVLAARMIVLVAITGAIVLTWVALQNPDPYRLIAIGIYCVAAVIPCVVLAARGR